MNPISSFPAGVYPAVVTPFDRRGRFDPEGLARLLDFLYAAGVDGVYVGGTTGEGMLQPMEQRKEVAEAAVRLSPGGKRVIVHVGAASVAEALEMARHAAEIGANAVSSLPPIGDYSFAEVRAFYERLANASEAPLLLYYFPEAAPSVTTLEQVLELCTIDNVAGLKFTSFDLYTLGELRRNGLTVFNGKDEVFAAGMLMGGSGGIGTFYNLVPELFVRVYRLAAEGRWEETRDVQRQINDVIRITLRYPVFGAVKVALRSIGMDCGDCLPPHRPLHQSEREQYLGELRGTILGPRLREML